MSESDEDESFIILPSVESYKQSTYIDETIDKCTPAKEGVDNLTADICLQFPSLGSSSSIEMEERIKLQSIVKEYGELNDVLQSVNVTMREHITSLQKSKDKEKTQNEIRAKQFNELQETVATLRNENLELQNELEHKIEQININEKSFREENREITKMLSDKTSQILNMAEQIEKLEQQHLENEQVNKKAIEHEYVPILEHERIVKVLEEKLSENVEVVQANSKEVKKLKDYIEKNEIENAEEKESNKLKIEREYVAILEHRRIVKDLEEKLSENVVKNLELVEMIQSYSKEVKIIKDNIEKNEMENAEEKEINKLKIEREYVPILEHRRIVKNMEEKLSENVEVIQAYWNEWNRRIVKDLEEKLSENVEVIQANSKEVKKLKDYIEKNEIENAEEKESNKLKIEREYVPILEHRRIVKDLEEKLSENVVKNLELVEMIQANSEEVKKLKDYIEKNEIENAKEKESIKLKIERDYVPILERRRIVKDLEEKLSENVEVIQANSKEVKKLKDYIEKNEIENAEEKESNKLKIEREYVPILEHRRIVKDLEEKLSENVVKNLELVEMIQANSEEVKKLKDYIEKNEIENAKEKESIKLKIERDYVPILEHRRIVKDLEEKLSENVVKNLELVEMIQSYSKEVKIIKDNIEKNEIENAEEKEINKLKIKYEYVPILEHIRIVKDLEEKLSENVVKNLELGEMIQANSEEVKKLKDYIEKNEIENAKEKESIKLKIERDYVPILEHRRIVKDLEETLSENVSKNLEFIDELDDGWMEEAITTERDST